ncbi:MAG: helix-turn-helix transcriptional regulator [Caldilineaceae bacterium]
MSNESNKLGTFLQTIREQKKLSLRAVEQAVGISNAYLSQLESGKIKQPSPTILHKLSEMYEVSYTDLMSLAGYPLLTQDVEKSRITLSARIGPVTEEEEDALVEYLQFLRSRRKRGRY